ncbi:proclotting enzyme-like [Aethina tumida]|uniref:proclotting enzyme-like n=1 Tax=Aethina tumida TaxID=116153 RepID=UPI00096B4C25|nr:proclotting enzyme-like [Aethina tumida]
MGRSNIGFLCLLFVVYLSSVVNSIHDDDDDTVVIEAEPEGTTELKRSTRQLFLQGPALPLQAYSPYLVAEQQQQQQQQQQDWTTNPLSTGPCITSKGLLGKCTSFRQCYPYFKIPDLTSWDSWVLGMYDACSYYTAQGRQMFGVCCTNPGTPSDDPKPEGSTEEPIIENVEFPEENEPGSESAKRPNYQVVSNWPPPLPTHPPHHTIPPLPTHPPSGIVTEIASSWYPSLPTKKPTKPSTKPPAQATEAPVIGGGSCGAKNGFQDQERIVGGHNADVNEWPWIAALFNGGRQFCGGSLIDDIHILSAAHCVAHMSSWDVARLTVRLGDHNIKTHTETRHIEKRVKRVVRHRGFDSRTLYNDIAILTLDSPVEFTKNIRPVCLPSSGRDFAGQTGTVIGWGSLRESGPQPAILQEVNIPIWSNRDCRQKYGHAAPGGIVDHMLCAGQASKDSCSGDSGGPLMVNSGKWTQVGVVSWGIGCGKGQYPGVYTRVEKFLPWITKNIK